MESGGLVAIDTWRIEEPCMQDESCMHDISESNLLYKNCDIKGVLKNMHLDLYIYIYNFPNFDVQKENQI